ncbi:Protein kinase domain-containing protein [Mycena sanguinolenta]|uniref:Protein kinase domain-containing protein n=1 Tax=Mycena sanguinolenta TaxID=230812 RepID=A0A8H6YA59_9AGAR|nr:Protein kinase domain-containing protein [Mycena sanguinolenta]
MDIQNQISADLSCVLQQMNSILSNRTTYKQFLSCRGVVAQRLLDLLQDLLDSSHELKFRFSFPKTLFSKALFRLSGKCGLHPTCFTLTGLEKMGRQVAGGGFGDICKGLVGGQIVAVKSMRQFADDDVKASLKKLGREALIWRQLSHPNLLPFFGLYMLEDRLCLVSPWMENGDLRLFLSVAPPDMDRVSLVFILIADVARGVEYLHSEHIPNILVTPSGRACITDFGLSTIVDELSLKMTFSSRSGRAGTVRYQAPELLKNESSNHYGSDVYAFACVSYEILTGKVPFFQLANEAAIIFKVVEGVRPSRLELISPELWLLLDDCWHQQTDKRPTTAAIAQRLSRRPIGKDMKPSSPDWDDAYSARFRRSVREWSLLPSVDEIERKILSKTTTPQQSPNYPGPHTFQQPPVVHPGQYKAAIAAAQASHLATLPQPFPQTQPERTPPLSEEVQWDDVYLGVLHTHDPSKLEQLLLHTDPELVMPLNGPALVSQVVMLTLVYRLSAVISETPPNDAAFKHALWWLQRVTMLLRPEDELIIDFIPLVLPAIQDALAATKKRLPIVPGPPTLEIAQNITQVQDILRRKMGPVQ